jgi:hypothetical protein
MFSINTQAEVRTRCMQMNGRGGGDLGGDRIIIIMIPCQKSWHNHFDVNAFSGRVVGAVIPMGFTTGNDGRQV